MLKRFTGAIAGVALMAGASAAQANDWNGVYAGIGIGIGAVVHDVDVNVPIIPAAIGVDGIGGEGFFGTLVVGMDHVLNGNIVVGGFAEYDFSNIETEINITGAPDLDIEQESAWGLGVRAGMLVSPETLWYVSLGYTQTTFDGPTIAGLPAPLRIDDFDGYFIGVGAESQIGNNLSLRGEYRYTQYQDETIFSVPGTVSADLEPSTHTGRLVLSYKLSRSEPELEALK